MLKIRLGSRLAYPRSFIAAPTASTSLYAGFDRWRLRGCNWIRSTRSSYGEHGDSPTAVSSAGATNALATWWSVPSRAPPDLGPGRDRRRRAVEGHLHDRGVLARGDQPPAREVTGDVEVGTWGLP
jgi:hypothetical protein